MVGILRLMKLVHAILVMNRTELFYWGCPLCYFLNFSKVHCILGIGNVIAMGPQVEKDHLHTQIM